MERFTSGSRVTYTVHGQFGPMSEVIRELPDCAFRAAQFDFRNGKSAPMLRPEVIALARATGTLRILVEKCA